MFINLDLANVDDGPAKKREEVLREWEYVGKYYYKIKRGFGYEIYFDFCRKICDDQARN